MSVGAAALLPFYAQYAPGLSVGTGKSTATASSVRADIIDIRSRITGTFTAAAADKFSISDLFKGTAPTGGSIVGYKVALRGDGGALELDGTEVTGQDSFTADQFSRLHFVAGATGSSQDLVVVAQSGKRLADGNLVNEVDSPAVQITASVTGTRSINAANALLTQPTGSDGAFVRTAQQASIFTGFGAARPGLTTVGNLTAAAADKFSLGDLFKGTAPTGGSIVGYKVALRGDGGALELDGTDVTGQESFTADQFSRLHFVAGAAGSSQDLVVVAQSGKRLPDGNLVNEVDSPALQITASVTGTRSINAANALLTQPTGSDAAFIRTAQQASIFTGFGAARPGLTTVGNLTAAAADKFSLGDLFKGTAPSGGGIVGYKVALRGDQGDGQLELDGNDVTGQESFTADQFSRLHFIAGATGSSQDLVVVAQSGKRLADGSLVNEVDSPAVQITASVTGTRSINAANALLTQPTGSDSSFIRTAQQASIFTGFGAARPSLTTVGNLTTATADKFSLADLFKGTAPAGGSLVGYKVALRGDGGQLELDGTNVTGRESFTADQFSRLHFVAGATGSSQDLVVVAQSGKRLADGSLVNEVDSPALQITTSVTGTRSINAANALLTQPTGSDAAFIRIAQQASIFTGFGAARPSLTTVGNLTAAAADKFSLGDLFKSTAPTGGSIVGYKVALRGDQGQLELDGTDVTGQESFTADQFSRLHFIAGATGSSQDLLVVAQSGKRLADGNLVNEVDSPALQITASVTGTRSINAANALLTQPTGSDAAFIRTAQQAGIFTGFGAARPDVSDVGDLVLPDSQTDALAGLLGSFQSTEAQAATAASLLLGVAGAVGGASSSAGSSAGNAVSALTWALSATELGGYQTTASPDTLGRLATVAYRATSAT